VIPAYKDHSGEQVIVVSTDRCPCVEVEYSDTCIQRPLKGPTLWPLHTGGPYTEVLKLLTK
jgi:hypothetical protein